MTDIEQKALALIKPGASCEVNFENISILATAFTRAIEQREATKQELSDYKQKVSDDVSGYVAACHKGRYPIYSPLTSFIIPAPKPDPLVEAIEEADNKSPCSPEQFAASLRAALEARGLEIREKGQ